MHETKADDGHSDFGQHYFTVYGLSDDIDCVDWPNLLIILTGFTRPEK